MAMSVLLVMCYSFITTANGHLGAFATVTNTTTQQYTYILQLQRYDGRSCGATVVSEKWAMTCAHCTEGGLEAILEVRARSSVSKTRDNVIRIVKIVPHEGYKPGSSLKDISLILAALSFHLGGPKVQQVLLPMLGYDEVDEGTPVSVVGWGRSGQDTQTTLLLKVDMPLISLPACNDEYTFCASADYGVTQMYSPDTGSPALLGDVQMGIFSRICKHRVIGPVAVFTRLTPLIPWIVRKMFEES